MIDKIEYLLRVEAAAKIFFLWRLRPLHYSVEEGRRRWLAEHPMGKGVSLREMINECWHPGSFSNGVA